MNRSLPDIYLFNPTFEYAIANGHATWHPNKVLQKMELDLATLPIFFTKTEDYVLVDRIPTTEFLATLKQFQIEIPHFIEKQKAISNLSFINSPKNKLLPWGWSPAAHKLLASLKPSCSEDFKRSPLFNWQNKHRDIYSKKFASDISKVLLPKLNLEITLPIELISKACTTQNEIETLIKNWGELMIKAPWSSSGRGLQPLKKKYIHPKVWDKILGIVQEQGFVIVEPYLNKQLDLALQFILENGKVKFLGFSNFVTDYKGQYIGNSLNGLPIDTPQKILDFIAIQINEITNTLIKTIEVSKLAKLYEGNFGIDMLIYTDKINTLRINPCLEINVKQNMGLLSLHLEKLIAGEKRGIFRTYFQPGETFFQFKKEMEAKYPLIIKDNKIESGFFALNEVHTNTLFGAYLLV